MATQKISIVPSSTPSRECLRPFRLLVEKGMREVLEALMIDTDTGRLAAYPVIMSAYRCVQGVRCRQSRHLPGGRRRLDTGAGSSRLRWDPYVGRADIWSAPYSQLCRRRDIHAVGGRSLGPAARTGQTEYGPNSVIGLARWKGRVGVVSGQFSRPR